MAFLNPLLLIGLLSLAIPIIVLLLFRKKVVINWAAYDWMKRAKLKTHKHSIVDDLLKLIAKLLLLLFLVLLMARPAIVSKDGGNKMLVIDNTLSMSTIIDDKTRLARAKELAESIRQEAKGKVAVYSFDGRLIPLSKLGGSGAKAAITNIEISPRAARFDSLVNALMSSDETKKFDTIYFFSDFQKQQYEDAASIKQSASRLENRKIIFMPVDIRSNLENVAITEFLPSPEGFYPGRDNEITVKIKNFSPVKVDSLPVTLKVDGQPQDRSVINLLPGGEESVQLNVSTPGTGTSTVKIEIQPDAFPADNSMDVIVSPVGAINILAVVKDRGKDPFEYDVFFRTALKAFSPGSYINYKRISPQQIYDENLNNYDVVITFGVPFATKSAATDAINAYLKKSHALIAFSDLSVNNYWKELGLKSTKVTTELSPVDKERLDNTYLSFMKGTDLDPTMVSLFKYSGIEAEKDTDLVTGRLYVKDYAPPVIGYIQRGNSNIILCGFMPYVGYANMFYNPNYIQMTMRMLTDATNRKAFVSYTGDEIHRIPLLTGDISSTYVVTTEGGESRQMEVKRGKNNSLFLSSEPFPRNTFCHVKRDDESLFSFGYNVTRADSNIEPAQAGDFKEAEGDQIVYQTKQNSSVQRAEVEYTTLMVILLILALIFDNYAHFWRPQ